MSLILDGKKASAEILKKISEQAAGMARKPTLAIVQIGDQPESGVYIRQKKAFGEQAGCAVQHVQLAEGVSEARAISEIVRLNADRHVHGIILQIPIPASLDKEKIIAAIDPAKDVDGLHPANVKILWENLPGGFLPATTRGILSLLDFYQISVAGKPAVVIGRSSLVGKPTAHALLNRDATVTLCHSRTEGLSQIARQAVILVVALGKARFIDQAFVSPGQVVIDVGINVLDGDSAAAPAQMGAGSAPENEVPKRKLAGDVDFDAVKDIVAAISPVPGGVGPMTVASLFENLLDACQRQMKGK